MEYVGLDIETSGLDSSKGHRLIQIGVSFLKKGDFIFDVRPHGDINISQEALDVNHFTLSRIDLGTPQFEVDDLLFSSLSKDFKPGSLTAVGWNVGSFDLVFIKKELPKTASLFSHRVADLTPIAMLEGELRKVDYRLIKEEWHHLAEKSIGGTPKWHDALYDAKAALFVWSHIIKEGI